MYCGTYLFPLIAVHFLSSQVLWCKHNSTGITIERDKRSAGWRSKLLWTCSPQFTLVMKLVNIAVLETVAISLRVQVPLRVFQDTY